MIFELKDVQITKYSCQTINDYCRNKINNQKYTNILLSQASVYFIKINIIYTWILEYQDFDNYIVKRQN